MLHGDACPVVESVLEPRITGEPPRDDAALSGTLGPRSRATKSPQGVIISSLEGFPSLCEQRGEDDPTVSWQAGEDRSVVMRKMTPSKIARIDNEEMIWRSTSVFAFDKSLAPLGQRRQFVFVLECLHSRVVILAARVDTAANHDEGCWHAQFGKA